MRATSSGRWQPWPADDDADALTLGLGVLPADADVLVDAGDVTLAELLLPDGLGEAGGLGVSCAQAAMTTRSLAGSALPPTPLRSTK